ncbi:MAG: HAD hydrolase family protein [Thomasclavelia sp.]|jgi:hydroxymethylpyrimidine pyrophosphatase-like HAD family hydrolase|nr:HAD hydrolase family protein [Thomasclavelia sp.]
MVSLISTTFVTASGCNKGSGLKHLCEILGNVQSYAIGDSTNDITMFEAASNAYTFNRVEEDIKAYTDKQVDYVYEVIEDMIGE